MSEQIDRAALSRRAGHILFTQGPEQPAATAREACTLLDALAAAEHRAAQAETRLRAVHDLLHDADRGHRAFIETWDLRDALGG